MEAFGLFEAHQELLNGSITGNLSACQSSAALTSGLTVCLPQDRRDASDLYEMLTASSWHILLKLRLLFYLVWPTETMFPSLAKVPRYVTEVSSTRKQASLANGASR